MEGFEVHNYWIPEHDISFFFPDFCRLALDGGGAAPFRLTEIKGVAGITGIKLTGITNGANIGAI